jgi:hypothetical protein
MQKWALVAQRVAQRVPLWDVNTPVQIPGTDLMIKGVIDRLDIAADSRVAVVRDYKTANEAFRYSHAGRWCRASALYACAVHALLNQVEEVSASLFYTHDQLDVPLPTPEAARIVSAWLLQLAVVSSTGMRYRDQMLVMHLMTMPCCFRLITNICCASRRVCKRCWVMQPQYGSYSNVCCIRAQ